MTTKEKAVEILANSIMLKGWFSPSGAQAIAGEMVDQMLKAGVFHDEDYRGDNTQFDTPKSGDSDLIESPIY